MDFLSAYDAWFARLFFERGLALMYLVAFISARNQFPALLGADGLLPVPALLTRLRFRQAPSLFHWCYSDRLFKGIAWTGMVLSAATLLGAFAPAPMGVSMIVWLVLWFLYLSIVNVGQTFYSFGWESMLLEAGWFAAFLSPLWMTPSILPILILRWMLFRVEVGAGLIKLRTGGVWLDRTALDYHHETQPMPNPLSRFVHHFPRWMLHGGVIFSHAVQVVVPFGLFLPQPIAGWAGALIIFHQLLLVVAGNYAWLNALTIVLAFSAFSGDSLLGFAPGSLPADLAPRPLLWDLVLMGLAGWTLILSIPPAKNLCSKNQLMNYSFNVWHLVNAYGAFGSVNKIRYEIIIEGAAAEDPEAESVEWKAYEFKGKPGRLSRIPPVVAPYHLRLDWLMWFLPFSVRVGAQDIYFSGYEPWFLRFIEKLLQGDRAVTRLLKETPFPDEPPRYVRARFYRYRFTTRAEHRESGHMWKRTFIDDYLPPISLESKPW
ncbi:MAG: lipase maturation factor family protein [Deltaproteobacteria bacterium]|nr:lipase maturation factor family protein [Deltaproteobacteria bacterium]